MLRGILNIFNKTIYGKSSEIYWKYSKNHFHRKIKKKKSVNKNFSVLQLIKVVFHTKLIYKTIYQQNWKINHERVS